MKNEHIKPGHLVPAELRLDIYKEAKRSIEAGDTIERHTVKRGLQFLLESILYGTLSNRIINYNKMFPEFKFAIDFIDDKHQALDELTKAVEKLKAELAPIISKGLQAIKTNISNRINDNLNELPFDAALDVYNQIRENMRERLAAEIAALEQPKNERLIYLKNLEL